MADHSILDLLDLGPASTQTIARLLRRSQGDVRPVLCLVATTCQFVREPRPAGKGRWRLVISDR